MDISQVFPSKFLAHADLKGQDHTLTIRGITMEEVGRGDIKPVVYFQGATKGMVFNKTNSNTVAHFLGNETDNWVGKQITIGVAWAQNPNGEQVQTIRVRPQMADQPSNAPLGPIPPSSNVMAGEPTIAQQSVADQNNISSLDDLEDEIPF